MNDKSISITDARAALSRLCKGDFRMRVPVQSDDDDMILSRALDELECLRAENERLQGAMAGAAHIANLTQLDLRELRQENERLRKALESIASIRYDFLGYNPEDAECMHRIAVEALKEGKHEQN